MKFTTLQEYFYKLQNILYLLVLIPLLAFIYLFISPVVNPSAMTREKSILIMTCLLLLVTIDWFVASILFYKKLIEVREGTELRIKLERYYLITIVRFASGSVACLILALGFYLTADSIFSVLFSVGLVLFFALWPRRSKVCRDLKLKGDERQMVLHKKVIV